MSAFVAHLAQEGTLVCPSCRHADWRHEAQTFDCVHCGAQWPVRHQVPDFFNRYQSMAAAVPAEPSAPQAELVAAIVRALDLSAEGALPAPNLRLRLRPLPPPRQQRPKSPSSSARRSPITARIMPLGWS